MRNTRLAHIDNLWDEAVTQFALELVQLALTASHPDDIGSECGQRHGGRPPEASTCPGDQSGCP
jgi:hypothetical protein